MSESPIAPSARAGRGSALRRFLDSDLFYSFSALAGDGRLGSGHAAARRRRAARALVAPHNPFDPASLSTHRQPAAAGLEMAARRSILLGTDDQGRDMLSAILYGMRISLVGRLRRRRSSPSSIGITLGLVAGYVGGVTDAVIMRIADVQLTFPAILIALLIDGVARAHRRPAGLRRTIVLLGAGALHRADASGCSTPARCAARRWSRRTRNTCRRRG